MQVVEPGRFVDAGRDLREDEQVLGSRAVLAFGTREVEAVPSHVADGVFPLVSSPFGPTSPEVRGEGRLVASRKPRDCPPGLERQVVRPDELPPQAVGDLSQGGLRSGPDRDHEVDERQHVGREMLRVHGDEEHPLQPAGRILSTCTHSRGSMWCASSRNDPVGSARPFPEGEERRKELGEEYGSVLREGVRRRLRPDEFPRRSAARVACRASAPDRPATAPRSLRPRPLPPAAP